MNINLNISQKTASLRELASQNHYAARVIQSLIRGYLCRKELWRFILLTINIFIFISLFFTLL